MNEVILFKLGIFFLIAGLILYLISTLMIKYYDYKLKKLNKKYNFEYIKLKPKVK